LSVPLAFSRDDLIASHGADYAMPNLLDHLAARGCSRLNSNWDRCGVHYVVRVFRFVVRVVRDEATAEDVTSCGYTVRITRKWLTLAGPPICPTAHVPLTAAS
jgi:hypothetical protein